MLTVCSMHSILGMQMSSNNVGKLSLIRRSGLSPELTVKKKFNITKVFILINFRSHHHDSRRKSRHAQAMQIYRLSYLSHPLGYHIM